MHVLNVNMSIDPVSGGGTAARTVKMSKFLARAGVQTTVLTVENGRTLPTSVAKGVQVNGMPGLFRRFHIPKPVFSELNRQVKGVDIIHLMNHWTTLNAMVYLIARRARKPYVFCPAGALPNVGRSRLLKLIYNQLIGYRIARQAWACIAISHNEIDHFSAYGVPGEKVRVIPNGVDPDDFRCRDDQDFREKYVLGENPFLLFMGRLNHIKGPDLLIRAFARIHGQFESLKLVLAGPDDGLKPNLIRIVKEMNLMDHVRFIGYVGGKEKSCAYHAADILVIPSRQEAMSIVVLEAGICGTPVVLTDRCGFDAVAEVSGGRVVPATIEGLEHGILSIMANSKNTTLFGANLKKFIEKNFIWDVIVRNYVDLYNAMMPGKVE
jgi:glycosyltransferase involved in cell wall biosynthesis